MSEAFRSARAGRHGRVVEPALRILRRRFVSDGQTQGYLKDGPVAVSRFEEGEEVEQHEIRLLRQRNVSEMIKKLLALIG